MANRRVLKKSKQTNNNNIKKKATNPFSHQANPRGALDASE